MFRLILRRLLLSIPLLLVVSAVTFIFQSFIPGDQARSLLGDNASQEQYEALRRELHLNDSLAQQYWHQLDGILHGNLGTSIFTGESVLRQIEQRLPVTLMLIVGALVIATVVGVLLGVQSATRAGVWGRLVDVVSLLGSALPSFWIALVLVQVFAGKLGWFPATGYVAFHTDPAQWANDLVLPVVALSVHGIASVAKVTRDGMLAALEMDSIRTLRAAGVPRRRLIWRHAMRNSSVSIATIVGVVATHFVAGAIFVETVFAIPGIGLLVVNATNQHDVPVVQGVALAITLYVVVVNLLTDVAYGLLDPKVRVS
jgi:peptide/nickel transport system permease protein